jgi:hypothetical protein
LFGGPSGEQVAQIDAGRRGRAGAGDAGIHAGRQQALLRNSHGDRIAHKRQRSPEIGVDGRLLLQAELVHVRAHIVDHQRNGAAGGERKLEAVERKCFGW